MKQHGERQTDLLSDSVLGVRSLLHKRGGLDTIFGTSHTYHIKGMATIIGEYGKWITVMVPERYPSTCHLLKIMKCDDWFTPKHHGPSCYSGACVCVCVLAGDVRVHVGCYY